MARSKSDEDLFNETTMTFGEHLEELRACLFKSIAGLLIGFVIGLFWSGDMVAFIQTPLEKALDTYYTEKAIKEIEAEIAELVERGYSKDIAETMVERRVLPEMYLINPAELLRQLGLNPDEIMPKSNSEEGIADDTLVPIYLWRPNEKDDRISTKSLNPHEPFTIFIKAGLLIGALLASPWIFYQIWNFVASGLYRHERKYIHIFLPFSLGLFLAGAALAFFFVFEPVLKFLFTFNAWLNIEPDLRISEWMSFVLVLPLGFGVAFQLPLVMLFLERIGVFTVEIYIAKWRIAILVIFVLSMFLTPADPTSMLLMAVPLTVLYVLGISLCRFLPRRESPIGELAE